jgi:hypothetical protein
MWELTVFLLKIPLMYSAIVLPELTTFIDLLGIIGREKVGLLTITKEVSEGDTLSVEFILSTKFLVY